MVSRLKLRGKPLYKDCYKAHITHEWHDYVCHCLGLIDPMYDEYLTMCYECKAFFKNAKYEDGIKEVEE